MMSRYAIVQNGVVTNVVIWDGEAECAAIPADAIKLDDGSLVSPGYTYDGVTFTPPVHVPLPSV